MYEGTELRAIVIKAVVSAGLGVSFLLAGCSGVTRQAQTTAATTTATTTTGSGPNISGVSANSITTSGAIMMWTTDVTATSQVEYGTTTAYGTLTALDASLITSHSVALTGLATGALYHYRVHSKNSSAVESISGDFAFATNNTTDNTPPTVSITSPAANATVSNTITVSANATDNVGVTSVQFLIDGANLGPAVTSSPYSVSWDTTTATNGAHTLTAQARDAAGNVGNASPVTVTVSNTGSPAPNSWSRRSTGVNVPGGVASIVSTQDFEATIPTCAPVTCNSQTADAQFYVQKYISGSPSSDATVFADGSKSLKFTITNGSFQGDAGWYDYNFKVPGDSTGLFGAGQEFFIQYKIRMASNLLAGGAISNNEGMKHDITTEGDSATKSAGDCSNSPGEVVTVSDPSAIFNGPWMYNNCGYSGGANAFMQSGYQPIQLSGIAGSNYLDQDASGCPHYSTGIPATDPTCFLYVGNEWFTIQKHIKIGAFGSPNSVIEQWMAHAGQPAVLTTNASDAAIVNDGSGGATGKYGKIQLSTYATGATFNVDSQVNFDDLIVSTRRIPDPDVATPNAPDSLSLSAISSSSITINWRVNSNNGTSQDDTGFLVERCSGTPQACLPNPQSGFSQIGTTAAHATSFVDNTVSAGHTYTYRLRATNSTGNSGYTVAICFNGGTTCGGTATI